MAYFTRLVGILLISLHVHLGISLETVASDSLTERKLISPILQLLLLSDNRSVINPIVKSLIPTYGTIGVGRGIFSQMPDSFMIEGSGFGLPGTEMTVLMTVDTGTPFQNNTSPSIGLPGTVLSPSLISVTTPFGLTGSFVTPTLRYIWPNGVTTNPNAVNTPNWIELIPYWKHGPSQNEGRLGRKVVIKGDIVAATQWGYESSTSSLVNGRIKLFDIKTLGDESDSVAAPVGDPYGWDVAVDDNYNIYSSSPWASNEERVNVGKVVKWTWGGFENPPKTWEFITASNGQANDGFGKSLAVSGTKLIVGAPDNDDDFDVDAGGAYIYDTETFDEEAILLASDSQDGDQYGFSVAISGKTAVVGAPYADLNDFTLDTGAVYIYTRVNGEWSVQQKLIPSGLSSNDEFGYSVAINDDVLVVGVPGSDSRGNNTGSVVVFTRSAGIWTQHGYLTPSDTTESFGRAVAISESNRIIVGAPAELTINSAAYVFEWSKNAGGTQVVKLTDPNPTNPYSYFAQSVTISGNRAVVGAWQEFGSGERSGSILIY